MLQSPLRRLFALLLLAGGCGVGWAATAGRAAPMDKPHRVVSLNMCSDQIIVTLADRTQIAGLTRNAASREMSAVAVQTQGLRLLGNSAEEVIAIRPDLVAGMPARRGAALSGIGGREYPLLDLKAADSYSDIERSISDASIALGQPARGMELIIRMRSELGRIPKNGGGRIAAYYQRRGFLTGSGTLIDDMMQRVGLVNLAQKLNKPPLSQLSLEELIAAKPDYLIVESATARVSDQGTEMLHHPAIAGIPRITIPQAWTVCGSPAYVDAVRSISRQIAGHDRRR